MSFPAHAAVLAASYFLGCAVSAYYVTKWKTGADVRHTGSGNAGATNAGRTLGRKWFVLIALTDILRGFLAQHLAFAAGLSSPGLAAAGVLAVCGHLWPVQLGFRGGKGIAVGYGVLLAASPLAAGLMWAVLAAGKLLTRSTTLGGLAAFAAAPALIAFLAGPSWAIWQAALIAGLILAAHRTNLAALFHSRRVPASPASHSEPSA